MRIDILTLFPEMFTAMLDESILARARKRGIFQLCCHQLRDFSEASNKKVDDILFGGGKGMLLTAQPVARGFDAISAHLGTKPYCVFMSPRGKVLSQEDAKRLAEKKNLAVLCGHYEGIDQRVLDAYIDEEVSIGDYVLTGGEIPAMVLVDAVCRMLPGVLADEACFTEESHYNGLLEYPQYTRPEVWRGRAVPQVLLSGHHENIRKWRRKQALQATKVCRPDLFAQVKLSEEDLQLLIENNAE